MKSVLVLCTGNSCRSQMAEGFLRETGKFKVASAGTAPSDQVHPKAIQVMNEIGVDISGGTPEKVDQYLKDSWDYVITVCGDAKDNCPVFNGDVKERLHIGFEDPANAIGTETEILTVFREIRDQIKAKFHEFTENAA